MDTILDMSDLIDNILYIYIIFYIYIFYIFLIIYVEYFVPIPLFLHLSDFSSNGWHAASNTLACSRSLDYFYPGRY